MVVVLAGCCRDPEDVVWGDHFDSENTYLMAWQIFEDGGTPEENERYWVEIIEAPGYFLNDRGEVYNGRTGRYLKPKCMDRHGHLGFCLGVPRSFKSSGRWYVYQHRLIAEYFMSNPHNYPVVRHLDDDPINQSLDNLAYGTVADNVADSRRNGHNYELTVDDRELSYRKSRTPIISIDLRTGKKTRHRGQSEAARELGLLQANIWKVLNNERGSTGGYTFRYDR